MEWIDPRMTRYIEAHCSIESELLQRLERETHAKVLMSRMVSGHWQGRVLAMISQMVRPEYILEVGTYTGYSALCLAEGLREGGKLYTIDINEELEEWVNAYFQQAGLADFVELLIGNALQLIPQFDLTFDLVFIDADKVNYWNYYEMILPKMKTNGIIVVDNVLWYGNVLKEKNEMDKDTLAIYEFNEKIQKDSRVENVILPLRDGLMLLRKK